MFPDQLHVSQPKKVSLFSNCNKNDQTSGITVFSTLFDMTQIFKCSKRNASHQPYTKPYQISRSKLNSILSRTHRRVTNETITVIDGPGGASFVYSVTYADSISWYWCARGVRTGVRNSHILHAPHVALSHAQSCVFASSICIRPYPWHVSFYVRVTVFFNPFKKC